MPPVSILVALILASEFDLEREVPGMEIVMR